MATKTRKPTPAQTAVIDYFDGGPVPTVRTSEATYHVCEREGWIVEADDFPYHKTTDAGRRAVGRA